MSTVGEDVADLGERLREHLPRLIVENEYGVKYDVREVKVYGAKTDDPAVVLRVVQS